MIEKLFLNTDNDVFKTYQIIHGELNELAVKKVNVFVGQNNSGKSRFLRELFKSNRERETTPSKSISLDFGIKKTKDALEMFKNYFSGNELEEISYTEEYKEKFLAKLSSELKEKLLLSEYINLKKEFEEICAPTRVESPLYKKYKCIIDKETELITNITNSTFIPVLRSLKKVSNNNDSDLLKKRVYKDYFEKLNFTESSIFSGEDLYEDVDRIKRSLDDVKESIESFESFMTDTFFNKGFKINAVEFLGKNKEGENIFNQNKDLFITIGDKQKPIYELGDGIQALIILLFPLFMNQDKNHILFIDEPELNLHPGMQRLLLETLMDERFENTQVYISTHSNHFLNVSSEFSDQVSVFSFKKNEETFEIENISKRADEALDLLGVHSSSIFTANSTVWVEGISERLYIRQLLKLYYDSDTFKESNDDIFKEDFHYAFIEYAGSNLPHWSFYEGEENIEYKAISRKVLVIADTDDKKDKKHENLSNRLGEAYYQLPCREIENILTEQQLKNTVLTYRKDKTSVINSGIDFSELKDEHMGNLIFSMIENQKFNAIVPKKKPITKVKTEEEGLKEGNSTISKKAEFTRKAIKELKSWKWEELSREAKELTGKVYSFIKEANE